jgi:hypothetical protein
MTANTEEGMTHEGTNSERVGDVEARLEGGASGLSHMHGGLVIMPELGGWDKQLSDCCSVRRRALKNRKRTRDDERVGR